MGNTRHSWTVRGRPRNVCPLEATITLEGSPLPSRSTLAECVLSRESSRRWQAAPTDLGLSRKHQRAVSRCDVAAAEFLVDGIAEARGPRSLEGGARCYRRTAPSRRAPPDPG